jgi:glycosyltransferase involved in cell wall biosynthesis
VGVSHVPCEPGGEGFLDRALRFGDAVARRLTEREYDVVHVRSIWEGIPALLLAARRGYRIVYEVNGLPSIELKYHYPGVAQHRDLITRLRSQEQALLRGAALVLTPSRTTGKYLRAQGVSGDRLRIIPNGVDAARFPPSPLPFSDPSQLLYVGTLAPWQGVPFLIEAFRGVLHQRPAHLRIAGGGRREWRKQCERLVRKLELDDHVELLGPVPPDAVPGLLAASDVCAAPLAVTDRNLTQGCCPIKLLEYLAAGRPVVAANLPAVREIVTPEESALLYKPDKPRRLTEALLRLLDDRDLALRLAENGARLVRERFTWERHNAAVTQAYRELLSAAA